MSNGVKRLWSSLVAPCVGVWYDALASRGNGPRPRKENEMSKIQSPATYLRQGKNIFWQEGRAVAHNFESINKAKKWSRLEQLKNGGLGSGFVRVIQ